MTDAHLIFLYRLIRISRGETVSLPGFDENAYVHNAPFDALAWASLRENHHLVSQTTSALIAGLTPEAWLRIGIANEVHISPVNILRSLIGHERHHIRVLRERYGLG